MQIMVLSNKTTMEGETLKNVIITRHLEELNSSLYNMLGGKSVSGIAPGVIGQTGIETLDLVRGAIDASHPDLVILIDALAACETETLTSTVQVSTTGVTPGGGVGNRRQALDRDALGVPVMTVGVPTVISAKALIYRALTGAGVITEDGGNPTEDALLHRALASADAGYVTPNNIDASVSAYARLLAQVINELVLGRTLAAQLCAFA